MSAAQSNLSIQDEISAAILQILNQAQSQLNCEIPGELTLDRPKNREHGDYATSIALALAKPSGQPPRKIAEIIVAGLSRRADIAAVEIAGAGFVNITLATASQGGVISNILAAGKQFGHGNKLNGVAINLEFISANPTGPLHLGHTRWAAVGDALGRVLAAAGAKVVREFYVNDRGVQMDKFGASLQAVALAQARPEDGYHGAYIAELATEVIAKSPKIMELSGDEQLSAFRDLGYELQLAQQKEVLDKFGTHFDVWFSEKSLYENNFFTHCQEVLKSKGHVFEEAGAIWLRTTDFGDDKDRVMVKSDGSMAYFASDSAYYISKRERGFEICIYMLGADHQDRKSVV